MNKLLITTTNSFQKPHLYCDEGSNAHKDGAFWRPEPPKNFFILGDYCQNDYSIPYGSMVVVRAEEDSSGQPLLAKPVDYGLVWEDKDSGAKEDGSVWMPIAPPGYVSLGGVATKGYRKPKISKLRCVRFDLVLQGTFGNNIWNDKGSGAPKDIGIWSIKPATNTESIPLGTFWPQSNYNKPIGAVFCLRIPSLQSNSAKGKTIIKPK